jgi:hypothetical protein
MSGEAIQELVNKIIATPIHIVNKAREVLEIK